MPDSDHRHGGDELAQTLRQLRQAAGLSGEAAGKAAGFSQAKISRMETGATVPTEKDLAEVLPGTRRGLAVARWTRGGHA